MTLVLVLPVTLAVNWRVLPGVNEADVGEIVTFTVAARPTLVQARTTDIRRRIQAHGTGERPALPHLLPSTGE